MIFSPELAEKVVAGEKTVTRRVVKLVPNLQADGWDGGRDGMVPMPCRYQEGRTYAVQPGRGKKAIGRIRILSVRGPEPVKFAFGGHWAMEGFELEREGFKDRYEFARYWESLYGPEDGETLVWRIEFELDRQSPTPPPER